MYQRIIVKRGAYISASSDAGDVMIAMDAIAPNVESIVVRTTRGVYTGAKAVGELIVWAINDMDDDPVADALLAAFREGQKAGWIDIDKSGKLFLPLKNLNNADN